MVQKLTSVALTEFATDWYAALDRHDDVDDVLARFIDERLVLNLPEGTFLGEAGFREWYDAVTARFFDEKHTLREVRPISTSATEAEVSVVVNWQFTMHDGHQAASAWGGFDAYQTWTVVGGENGPRMTVYTADKLDPMPGSASI
jgi:ketosteroid isomerase-like protein